MAGPGTNFKWVKGGLQAYTIQTVPKYNDIGERVGTETMEVEDGPPIKNLKYMDSYFYGQSESKGQDDANAQGDAERLQNSSGELSVDYYLKKYGNN